MSSSATRLPRDRDDHRSAAVDCTESLLGRRVLSSDAWAWFVVAAMMVLCTVATRYVANHFAMTTDTYALLSSKLPWRVRQAQFNRAFPQDGSGIVVVMAK